MNWVLMEKGYPKMFVPVKGRQQYYEAIDMHNAKRYKEYCNKMFGIMIGQINIVHKK